MALHDDKRLVFTCADNGVDSPMFLRDAAGPWSLYHVVIND